ncbi:conserved hypothetical protein [Xanthomonas phaseoli pv. phaseoli]|uniref:Uncharacterized protein n=1 Tax=Xanthomonas campestris pv. phaseoli TaxID=317013 RepID=A0AB38DWE4_XANCH|nr:conserved hypothetical protein [Xanthomonas phaseoli pv. phaseoli]SON77330.1 conserved hypothetical protein [Xanthomonas phaseoli pv. phaseoli]SON82066.1 conserved hypothetical protein [Xanthomonas phaseoli pv. phaseoli]SOO31283.1 conserved hypothetical protein [Xanthomonas phaseoli pv. phaseoli]
MQRRVKRTPAPANYRAVESSAAMTGASRLRKRVTGALQYANKQRRSPVPHAVVLAQALRKL